ncbi:hypothetical protein TVAG_163560 [Trichomonas vaginalis G3]|uniref:DUF3447 domain-containing protein n=1 Tax=Trichomonas vaginalis (strain ATCC PRA-98 / G3) TaxID=412133 RepID=A2DG33_TRIV3|nr:protein of unknown function (DUF3447) [Trichomonas vaginalis G3]EAY20660.1 hypothetical protein TVAG_163560 [Trichomonas vaginalis G3]KAI5487381.1 protein of unknown function (DUF3447) [Trichomonas vaginalis G3]|eukprot:XP_001581646.1 hypothetical protein [Trichomonas vaginalis G3]
MSDQDIDTNEYCELRSIHKHHIDLYNMLYQLNTKNEEELNSIYKMIKTELIESNKHPQKNIIRDILEIITYNNRSTKSYLALAKLISDDYHVTDIQNIPIISNYLFYKEYGIKLYKFDKFKWIESENLDILEENTIYRAIMDNDKDRFIFCTEKEGFDKDQKIKSDLLPHYKGKYSLLELCCYYGAVDCFKFLRTKFNSEITETCLELSFLGRNHEIMSECLKYHKPDYYCMKYAIISHNIDFVTFLMNEYNIEINLTYWEWYNNLEAFLVYYDQTDEIDKCFVKSAVFDIPSLCEYFLSLGANINEKDISGKNRTSYCSYL